MNESPWGHVVFAGGGTGGHLYPALAIAGALRASSDGGRVRCLFVCSDRELDSQILGKAGEEFVVSPAKPLIFRPRGLARFVQTWGRSVREARQVLQRLRQDAGESRVVVVAMGGFVAAPVVQGARVERVPVLLVNLDAVPGKANRYIASLSRRAGNGGVVSAVGVHGKVKGEWPVVGPIVRAEARAIGTPEECRRRLGLDPAVPVLMVTGGSQGAKSVNQLMVELARREGAVFRNWQVLHQCGKAEAEGVTRGYAEAGLSAQRVMVREFSDRMGDWWGAAELAVSRAGAGSVAEACANRAACVFLPYPFHRDRHQQWNADELARAGGGVVVTDHVDPLKNAEEAGRVIVDLMRNRSKREEMRRAIARLGAPDGAAAVAARVRSMLGREG